MASLHLRACLPSGAQSLMKGNRKKKSPYHVIGSPPPASMIAGSIEEVQSSLAYQGRVPIPGMIIPPSSSQLAQHWTASRRFLLPQNSVKLLQMLDIQRPPNYRELADQVAQNLLYNVARSKQPEAAEFVTQCFITMAAMGFTPQQPASQLMLLKLADMLQIQAQVDAAGPTPLQLSDSNREDQVTAKQLVAERKRKHAKSEQQATVLSPSQLAHIASCMVHIKYEGDVADAIREQLMRQAVSMIAPSSEFGISKALDTVSGVFVPGLRKSSVEEEARRLDQMTPHDAALLFAAAVHTPAVMQKNRGEHANLPSTRQELLGLLQDWMLKNVPSHGGYVALLSAASLACWQSHRRDALRRIAGRTLKMHVDMRDEQRDALIEGYVQALRPSMRNRLAEKLHVAANEHKLLRYLYAAGAPLPVPPQPQQLESTNDK